MSTRRMTSNTPDCFRDCVGRQVTGVLFDTFPLGRYDLSGGTKTLIFDDGYGLTISSNGSYWIENPEDVQRGLARKQRELMQIDADLIEAVRYAGAAQSGVSTE